MKIAKSKKALLSVLALFAAMTVATYVQAAPPPGVPRGNGPAVYVTSQNLAYDTIVLGDLPQGGGPFQKLEPGVGPTGLQTEFGPGDVGYVGGRWWVDANGDHEMNEGDVFFLCPLLGNGYAVD